VRRDGRPKEASAVPAAYRTATTAVATRRGSRRVAWSRCGEIAWVIVFSSDVGAEVYGSRHVISTRGTSVVVG
jgi:hypothetical protein